MAKVLITGITGQDGSFLAEQALADGDEVYGVVRRSSSLNQWRIRHFVDKITLLQGDLLDLSSLITIMTAVKPDEVYNLASQSDVAISFKQPILTANVTGVGTLNLLESVRLSCPSARVYQASSSEMFGLQVEGKKQNEQTHFNPRSPYGSAKVFAHHCAVNFRESYNIFVANGILFNHESERRGINFVTRKITSAVAEIYHGRTSPLFLGDTSVSRDWGFAGDYTQAMRMILRHDSPEDFVIATGKTWTLTDFLDRAFRVIDKSWQDWVLYDPKLARPADIPTLCGDYTKAKTVLGWQPSVSFDDLVLRMVESDIKNYGENNT